MKMFKWMAILPTFSLFFPSRMSLTNKIKFNFNTIICFILEPITQIKILQISYDLLFNRLSLNHSDENLER